MAERLVVRRQGSKQAQADNKNKKEKGGRNNAAKKILFSNYAGLCGIMGDESALTNCMHVMDRSVRDVLPNFAVGVCNNVCSKPAKSRAKYTHSKAHRLGRKEVLEMVGV